MSLNVSPPERLQTGVLEFLRSGDNYRAAYGAAFAYRGEVPAAELSVPTLLTAADHDPLLEHLDRIAEVSDQVTVQGGGSAEATIALALEFLRAHPGELEAGSRSTRPVAGRMHNEMLDVPGGQLRIQRNNEAEGTPVIVLHDAAGSSVTAAPAASSFVGRRPVVALDLPGHGESDALLSGDDITVTVYSDWVEKAMDSLGYEKVDIYGQWGGGLVALDLAVRKPERVSHVAMSGVMYFDDDERDDLLAHYAPEILPDWFGGHLLQCWHLMRAQGLFWPWYRSEAAAALPGEPFVDPELIHRRVVEMLKSPDYWHRAYRAHFSYDLKAAIEAVSVPTGVGAVVWDANLPHTKKVAADYSKLDWVDLPISTDGWGEALVNWMDES
jgi:pimeloyl-ACP methyl ester carboxylesterase